MIAEAERVTYGYPGSPNPALSDVSVRLDAGQLVLLAGDSGSGKSTLLRLFNGLVPQFYGGRYAGRVCVDGLDPAATPVRRMATVAGMVFQEPEAQSVAEVVEDEIAFAMEQQALPRSEMLTRSSRLMGDLGIGHLRGRRLAALSGGERQRVAIAAVLALEPRLLLLDEPLSQLDRPGAASVARALGDLASRGVAVVASEHRYDHLLPLAGTVWTMAKGKLSAVPATGFGSRATPAPVGQPPQRRHSGAALAEVHGVTVAYPDGGGVVDVDLSLREGEIVALVGPNGSGKTTLLRTLAGLVRPVRGEVRVAGRAAPVSVAERSASVGLVPQDPMLALYRESVVAELRESLRSRRRAGDAERALEAWGVRGFAARSPRDLSVGQQQRVAIAAMLAHEPPVWLLDEPTRGADSPTRAWLANRLRGHAAGGGAVIVATHDLRWAASFATRFVTLDAGRVSSESVSATAASEVSA